VTVRRRIVWTVIVAVVVALVLAGLGTLVLSSASAQRRATAELVDQARAISDTAATLVTSTPRASAADPQGSDLGLPRATLRRIRDAFELEDIGLTLLAPAAAADVRPPEGVTWSTAEIATLRGGGTVTGRTGDRQRFASAGSPIGRSTIVVTLVSTDDTALGRTARWFLLASSLVVLLAVVAAMRLGDRLARPITDATAVTSRIAHGDLAARLVEPEPDDTGETAVLARSVNSMADALERSKGLDRQFLMSVSHDLRTPLTSIRGYAEAIADGTVDDPARAAEVITTESARMERLVQDLLDLARLDANEFTLHRSPVPVGPLVQDALDRLEPEVHQRGLVLDRDITSTTSCDADPDRVVQVLGNLVANAVRFAARRIVVTVRDDDGAVTVGVADDGAGIAAEDLPHVFERLYQGAGRPLRQESGTGLGLAIVRELVAAMGGEVGVSSTPGAGTVVWFHLPGAQGTAAPVS
jgi:signal transduction histidine kinase